MKTDNKSAITLGVSILIIVLIVVGYFLYVKNNSPVVPDPYLPPTEDFTIKTPPPIDASPCFNDEAIQVPCKG